MIKMDWENVVEAVQKRRDPNAKTAKELQGLWRIGNTATNMRLRKLMAAGAVRQEKAYVEDITGRAQLVPVYILEDKK